MKNYLLCFSLLVFYLSFSQNYLEPVLDKSFGLNHHTNRDIGMFSHVDPSGNTYLIGTTEKDSTFNDLVSFKLNAVYQEVWKKVFSVPTNLSYDVPVKTFLSAYNELYIIGRSSFNGSNRNGLVFIIKYDADGNLLFNRTLGNLDGSDYIDYGYIDARLNDDGSLNLVYAPYSYVTYSSNTFRFLKIDAAGNIVNSFEKTIENQDVTGLIQNGVYYLLRRQVVDDMNNIYSYSLFRISEDGSQTVMDIADTDFTNFFNSAVLSEDVQIVVDLTGNIFLACPYLMGNVYSPTHKLQIVGISSDNQLKYTVATPDTDDYYLIGSFINDENRHIVIANNIPNNSTDFLIVDGDSTIQTLASWTGYLATGFKKNDDGTFFLTSSNADIHLFSNNLNILNSFATSDSYSLFDFSKIDNTHISVMGTRFAKMFPESDFYTQLDIIAEKVMPAQITENFEFSGIGTSYAYQEQILIDNDNNYIILTRDKLGPEYLGAYGARPPKSNRVLKYDSNLNLIWQLEIPNVFDILDDGGNGPVIDADNNIFINALSTDSTDDSGFRLIKVSSGGEILYVKNSYRQIHIACNGAYVYIISPKIYNTNDQLDFKTTVYQFNANDGELINQFDYQKVLFLKSYISSSGEPYFYMNTGLDLYDQSIPTIKLFKLNELIFERELPVTSRSGLGDPVIYNNGDLVFVTGSSTYSQNRKIHKITLQNDYSFINTPYSASNMLKIDNGKLFAIFNNTLKIFNPDLSLYAENLTYNYESTSGKYFITVDNTIWLFSYYEDGLVTVFNDNLEIVNTFNSHDFLCTVCSKKDKEGSLITTGTFGNNIYTMQWYGWYRGYIRKYNLDTVLSVEDDFHRVSQANPLLIYPNPAAAVLNISTPMHAVDKIVLYDLNGRELRTLEKKEQLDLTGMDVGIYLIKVYEGDQVYHAKVIKNR